MIGWLLALSAFGLGCVAQIWAASDPVIHVLLQMPLLALAGAALPLRSQAISAHWAGPLFVLTLTTALIWMLPRSVDAALTGWPGHIAKFLTIPLLLGLPLRLSWPRMGLILRGFIKAQSVSMLLLLAFVYTHAPLRICNSYLVDDQQRLGIGFAFVAIGLALIWIVQAFTWSVTATLKGLKHDIPSLGQ